MSTALILEGGGMRGLYTAGVLDTMLDDNLKFDSIYGVSAGAVFGINYLSKQKGRVLRYNKKYASDKRYMSFRSFITTGNFINKQFAYYDLPFKLDLFDEETYSKSKTDFYAVVTNIKSGNPEYKKIINCSIQIEELRASSSLPYASKPVKINDELYLDGGISDPIPIKKALVDGYDKIIIVLTRPEDYRKKKSNTLIPKLIYHQYPNLVESLNTRYSRYNETIEYIEKLKKDNKIIVIRPSKLIPIKRLEKDPNKLQEIYDLGVSDYESLKKEIKKYLK